MLSEKEGKKRRERRIGFWKGEEEQEEVATSTNYQKFRLCFLELHSIQGKGEVLAK